MQVRQLRQNKPESYLSWSVWSLGSAWLSSLVHALSSHVRVHPNTPPLVSPSASASVGVFASLLLFSLWPSAVRPAAKGVGWNMGGEENGKRRGVVKERQEEEELPLFFFLRTRPVASTPPCYIIHSGTSAMGLMEKEVLWGGSPTGRAWTSPAKVFKCYFLLFHKDLHVCKG